MVKLIIKETEHGKVRLPSAWFLPYTQAWNSRKPWFCCQFSFQPENNPKNKSKSTTKQNIQCFWPILNYYIIN